MSPWHRRQDYSDSFIRVTPIAVTVAIILLWVFV